MEKKYWKNFSKGHTILIALIVGVAIFMPIVITSADDIQFDFLRFPIYFNGEEISLDKGLIIDGHTYVQLKEFCEKVNIQVNWVDPQYHQMLIPGGNFPSGINLTNSSFIYVKNNIIKFDNGKETITGVDISNIYNKYQSTDKTLHYSFGDEGFVIRTEGSEQTIPLNYNPSYGKMYLEVNEFKEKILPYLVDICMQEI